ncbi:Rieske 2Fe-2S domain-containing protein [Eikenella sp. S3360]|uniref:Rieske 2Fe-2S domain-containing protein n=1 Tax=Eikenella glucosivorans TaxID=2766967 RepID=A0ABS0NAI7_9NEIS|nr:Rieske 2Fe-2S domain-containing protein [Eikenella glucosivorans]MBH5329296.1 Rieske 2Fe-2S domain-containing protein [Eikenella glucosivorans]
MNIPKMKRAWYPLMPSAKLKNKPLARKLLGQPLVLARLGGQAVCFDDCCPHRHVPLSAGKIVSGRLQCGYHGWQFDASGKVCAVPGGMCACEAAAVPAHACREHGGWVWVCLAPDVPFAPPADFDAPPGFETVNAAKQMEGDFIHAIENFLDPTHTPYVHRGLLRGAGRQSMAVSQSHHAHGFSTRYRLGERQNGLINRLFDKGITINDAAFTFPGLARIDYLTPNSHEYRISAFFIPQDKGQIGLSVRVHFPKSRLPLAVKTLLFRPFIECLLVQDAAVIQRQYRHHSRYFASRPYCSTPNDLVIDHLLHLLLENAPEGVDKSGEMVLYGE